MRGVVKDGGEGAGAVQAYMREHILRYFICIRAYIYS